MRYVEIDHDDYVIVYLNQEYFCLPLFIYEQLPTKLDIISYAQILKYFLCKKVPPILSNIVSKTLKIKRTQRLW